MENKIKVVELFAGVGGFRLGLEGWNNKSNILFFKEKSKGFIVQLLTKKTELI